MPMAGKASLSNESMRPVQVSAHRLCVVDDIGRVHEIARSRFTRFHYPASLLDIRTPPAAPPTARDDPEDSRGRNADAGQQTEQTQYSGPVASQHTQPPSSKRN